MIKTLINNKIEEVETLNRNGTCLQEKIDIAYSKLVKIFGEPKRVTEGYKIDAQWVFLTYAGVAAIYNYKTGINYLGKDGKEVEDIRNWHIGGHSKAVVPFILKALGISQ